MGCTAHWYSFDDPPARPVFAVESRIAFASRWYAGRRPGCDDSEPKRKVVGAALQDQGRVPHSRPFRAAFCWADASIAAPDGLKAGA